MKSVKIGIYEINQQQPPFIIAEMSGNHNQSFERAVKIIETAASIGVNALKIQTYTADTMTLDINKNEFFINDTSSLWNGKSLYELYKQAYTPWEWHKDIFEICNKLGLIGFSTPFDETSVDFLESLNVPCYKIASFENNDLPLIKKVAKTGKPIIISTGMATISELNDTVQTARDAGCKEIILLKCTSSYPAPPENANVVTIPHMRELFQCQVGISDHTTGMGTSIASIALGATVIEKHFTLDRRDGGVDSAFSLEPEEMKNLIIESKTAWRSLGKITYGPTEHETSSIRHRRSLYVSMDMEAGEYFNKNNLRCIRPGLGLAPKYYSMIIGKQAKIAIKKGTPVNWDIIC